MTCLSTSVLAAQARKCKKAELRKWMNKYDKYHVKCCIILCDEFPVTKSMPVPVAYFIIDENTPFCIQ